ncbi:MAG: helix-turn-helix transcriptional regulator [Nitrospinales bacterium]
MVENLHYLIVLILLSIGATVLWSLGKINFVLSRKKAGSSKPPASLVETQIAVIDKQGKIIAVNETWKRLSKNNKFPSNLKVDTNFLAVCEKSSGKFSMLMQKLVSGIQAVLEGTREEFVLKYPEPTPKQPTKVMMYATSLTRRSGGAMFGYLPLPANVLNFLQVDTLTLVRAARMHGKAQQLTQEEQGILDLFAAGFSRASIAAVQGRSPRKIDAFLSAIFRKLGIQQHSDLLHLVH